MSVTDRLPIQLPSDGIKGLAMMAPVVGLPLFIHALSGAVLSGLGFAALTFSMSPFRKEILKAVNAMSMGKPVDASKTVQASTVVEPVSIKLVNQEPTSEKL